MGSVKLWYFTALGVAALSLSSPTGRCVFDKATTAVEQFRAKTMPYVAMLEMTLNHPQNTPQVRDTMTHVEDAVAQAQAQKACAEATVARLQAVRARIEAQKAAQRALVERGESIQDQVDAASDLAWSQLSSVPVQNLIAQKTVFANHALVKVQSWKADGEFAAPRVTLTPNQLIIEGPQGTLVAPRTKMDGNVPSFPARPMPGLTDPI
jgi:hypothetical protein